MAGAVNRENLDRIVGEIVQNTPVTDIHTHLYDPAFGDILLWGVDELITYHYLIAETMRWVDLPYEEYWRLSKVEQANLVWQTLFLDNSPYSEACRGVLTTLKALGLDVARRDLKACRKYLEFGRWRNTSIRYSRLLTLNVVMTNDPLTQWSAGFGWMKLGQGKWSETSGSKQLSAWTFFSTTGTRPGPS